jgi:hypothetical protein
MRGDEASMGQTTLGVKRSYKSPELKVLGTVQELTHQDKMLGLEDGFTFLGIPITNNSTNH